MNQDVIRQNGPAGFVRAYPPARPGSGPAFWLPFLKGELLTRTEGDPARLHRGDRESVATLDLSDPLYLGTLGGVPCLAADADPDADVPEGWAVTSLRALFGRVSEAEYGLAGYASQMLYWRRTSGFCPVCGHRRETREEAGLEIADLAYAGSQPWPYPHQLMVGFTARYAGGEIVIDEAELERAAWFEVGSLPDLPPPLSLSRQMIDAWIAKQKAP